MSDIICVVTICKDCRQAVIYKYTKSIVVPSFIPLGSGGPWEFAKPDIEWCSCGSDEPRHLCRVTNEDLPGLEEKCEKCEFRFSCATSRIEVVYNGHK